MLFSLFFLRDGPFACNILTMKQISHDKRLNIISQLKSGKTVREAAKNARVSTAIVSAIRKSNYDNISKDKGGRPRKINTLLGPRILHGMNANEYKNATHASRQLSASEISISSDTVRRLLHDAGWQAQHKP